MAIAATLNSYLRRHQIDYHLLKHRPTANLLDAARAASLPPAAVAHSLLLEDEHHQYWIAVLGSDRHLDLKAVARVTGAEVRRCSTGPSHTPFLDCDPCIVPPFGAPYSLPTLFDSDLLEQPRLYFEDGDATELIRIEQAQLHFLVKDFQVVPISTRAQRH